MTGDEIVNELIQANKMMLGKFEALLDRATPDAREAFRRSEYGLLRVCLNEELKEGNGSGWIKVTPDTMPPDDDTVMVTVEFPGGDRYMYPEARFDKDRGKWEWPYEAGADYWEDIKEKVTHWMPHPKPAED